MSAQSFNFAHKYPQNKGFLHFLTKIFPQEEIFPTIL